MRWLPLFYLALIAALASGCATTSRRPRLTAAQLKDMGEKAFLAHDTANALQFLTEAEQKHPDDAAIEYDLGLAYNQRGFQAEALKHIQKALQIRPDYPEALNALGSMYANAGQFDLATTAFQKAMNDPFYQTPQIAALNLGQLYEKRGDLRSALSYYRQAVKLDPHYAQAWFRIGRVSEQSGNNERAKQAYEAALRASPEMAEAYLRLGVMSYRNGNFEDAAGSLAKVERFAPNSDLANQAQSYLDKINSGGPALNPDHYNPSRLKIQKPRRRPKEQPPVSSVPQSLAAPLAAATASANTPAKVQTRGSEDGATPGNTTTEDHQSGAWRYIVKIGAYSDKARAEAIKSSLCEKGYNAVLRRASARTFVVELKSVNTSSKAATLKTQIAGETNRAPTVIKVRAR